LEYLDSIRHNGSPIRRIMNGGEDGHGKRRGEYRSGRIGSDKYKYFRGFPRKDGHHTLISAKPFAFDKAGITTGASSLSNQARSLIGSAAGSACEAHAISFNEISVA